MSERGSTQGGSTPKRPAGEAASPATGRAPAGGPGPNPTRPAPATPRPYEFPAFERHLLPNGLTVIAVDLPGRPLVSATLVLPYGAADEPDELGGVTVLAARALSEGTARYDAIGLTEAGERLGASLHAEAGWDSATVGVDVPASRLGPALALLAEMALRPTFPEAEVERLRDERLNDILQAHADPRRRADEAFIAALYTTDTPYHRPPGGRRDTVAGLARGAAAATYARELDPGRMTLIVGGDLTGVDPVALASAEFGALAASDASRPAPFAVRSRLDGRIVRIHHRPGAVQTEIRIGHIGLPRRIPDFHAVSVMSAILGGLFASRLNMKIREEKGYAYGAGAGFDLRRAAGPFSARAAVNTEVTAPAVVDILAELVRMRDEPVTDAELAAARDFLVGVFPLRFETPGPVVGSIAGLVVHALPDDELARYRPAIEAVGVDDVRAAARDHIDVEGAAIVLVGDAERIEAELAAAALGPIEVVRDPDPALPGSLEGVDDELGPVEDGA